jgi:hypothetical protein
MKLEKRVAFKTVAEVGVVGYRMADVGLGRYRSLDLVLHLVDRATNVLKLHPEEFLAAIHLVDLILEEIDGARPS